MLITQYFITIANKTNFLKFETDSFFEFFPCAYDMRDTMNGMAKNCTVQLLTYNKLFFPFNSCRHVFSAQYRQTIHQKKYVFNSQLHLNRILTKSINDIYERKQ